MSISLDALQPMTIAEGHITVARSDAISMIWLWIHLDLLEFPCISINLRNCMPSQEWGLISDMADDLYRVVSMSRLCVCLLFWRFKTVWR
jgi:hypothetical protein